MYVYNNLDLHAKLDIESQSGITTKVIVLNYNFKVERGRKLSAGVKILLNFFPAGKSHDATNRNFFNHLAALIS